ncbi:hypothetical protein C8Q78DRAFT_1123016 [Trametes maxima]|nr:hypothetical protein C8Q78DRAFT_1123016 [Trametes maxima]
MDFGRGFFRVRAAVFGVMMLVSLLWTILLSVEVFLLYDKSDASQRNFVGVLIFINALTAMLLPALLIVQFRPWLDAARLLFLILAHFGVGGLFTAWQSSFKCPTESNAEHDRCRSINLAIMICSWVVPALLTWYSAFLAVMYYWRRDHPKPANVEKHLSDLPMMLPSRKPSLRRPSVAPVSPAAGPSHRVSVPVSQVSRPSWLAAPAPAPGPSTPIASTPRAPPQRDVRGSRSLLPYENSDSSFSSPRSSGRLSKPAPPLY